MKVIAQNRRAKFDYEILETLEAGIVLSGQEVKSCRMGHADLRGAYLSFQRGRPVLKQAKIMPYAFASGLDGYDPGRDRQLLLSKEQVEKVSSMIDQKGIAVIPLEIRAGKYIKMLLGVGRGRKRLDKRAAIKEKDVKRKLRKGQEI